jgi:hypothetical protein
MDTPVQSQNPLAEETQLLLTAREAAELLNISEKTLWNHSGDRGNKIPVVRFGRTLRYSVESLRHWIRQQCGDVA